MSHRRAAKDARSNHVQPGRRTGASRHVDSSPWRSPLLLVAVLAAVVLSVAGLAFIATRQRPADATQSPDADSIARAVTSLPQSELDAVGTGGYPSPVTAIAGTPSGRPLVFYLGAEYCPYCAAARWTVVQALGRFGTFTGLSLTTSSSSDRFPDTSSFSFRGSSYTSPYLDFVATEVADRNQRPLEAIPSELLPIVARYDPNQVLPFLYIDGRYVATGSNYFPDTLHGLSWSEIVQRLQDPSTPVARGVIGNANQLTAAICQVTAGQPAAVCSAAAVRSVPAPAR